MKEDYLWDKSGAADAEIERLENALAVFRYQETDAPALPAKIMAFEKKTPRRFFRFALPLAFATLTIIAVGIWFQISREKIEVADNLPEKESIAPPSVEKKSIEIAPAPPDETMLEKAEVPKRSNDQKIIKVRKTVPAIARQDKAIARNISVKKPSVVLTKDEKYAYDQLMLALSITGSKLKIVEDKIHGTDEPATILKNGR